MKKKHSHYLSMQFTIFFTKGWFKLPFAHLMCFTLPSILCQVNSSACSGHSPTGPGPDSLQEAAQDTLWAGRKVQPGAGGTEMC